MKFSSAWFVKCIRQGEPLHAYLIYARGFLILEIFVAFGYGLRIGPGKDLCWESKLSKAFSSNTGLEWQTKNMWDLKHIDHRTFAESGPCEMLYKRWERAGILLNASTNFWSLWGGRLQSWAENF